MPSEASKTEGNCKISKQNGSNQKQQLSLPPKEQCQYQSPPESSYCPSPILQQESLSSYFLDDFVISFKKQTPKQLHCQDKSAEKIIKQENNLLDDSNNNHNNNNNLIVIEDQSEIIKDKGKKKNKLKKTTKTVTTTATKRKQKERCQLIESPKKTRKRQKKEPNGGNKDIINKNMENIDIPDQHNEMVNLIEHTETVEERRQHEMNSNIENIRLDGPQNYQDDDDDDDADLIQLQQLIDLPKKQHQEASQKIKIEESLTNKQSQSQNMYVQLGRQQLTEQIDSCVVQTYPKKDNNSQQIQLNQELLRSSQQGQSYYQYQNGNSKQISSQLLQQQDVQRKQQQQLIDNEMFLLLSQSEEKNQKELDLKDLENLAEYYEQKYSEEKKPQGENNHNETHKQFNGEFQSQQRSLGILDSQKQSQQVKQQSNLQSQQGLSQQKQQQKQGIIQTELLQQQQQQHLSEPITQDRINPNNEQNSQRNSDQQSQSSTNYLNNLPNNNNNNTTNDINNPVINSISSQSFCTVENQFQEKVVDLLYYFMLIEQQKKKCSGVASNHELFDIASKTFTEAIQREVAKQTQEILTKAGLNNQVDIKVTNVHTVQPEIDVEQNVINPVMTLITEEIRNSQQNKQLLPKEVVETQKGQLFVNCSNEHKDNSKNSQFQIIKESQTLEKKDGFLNEKENECPKINNANQGVKQGINRSGSKKNIIINVNQQTAQKKKLSDLRKKDTQIEAQGVAVTTNLQSQQQVQAVAAQVFQQQQYEGNTQLPIEGSTATTSYIQNNVLKSLEIIAGNPATKIVENSEKQLQLPSTNCEVIIQDSQQNTMPVEKGNADFVGITNSNGNAIMIQTPRVEAANTLVPVTATAVGGNLSIGREQLNQEKVGSKNDRSFAIISQSKSSIRNVTKQHKSKDNESRLYGSFTRDIADMIVNHRFDPKQFTQEELLGNKVQQEEKEGGQIILNEQLDNQQQQSLKSQQSPQLVDYANVQKFYYKICWKRRSSGRIPLPTYFTFKQLKDSAPRLLFDYFTKIAKLKVVKNQ